LKGHTNEVTSLIFIGNKLLVSGGSDQTIRIWNICSGVQIWMYFCTGQIMAVEMIGNNLIAAGDGLGRLLLLKTQGIKLSDFTQLDIRVGNLVKCKKHFSSENLYIEEIDVGELKPRQVVSNLVKHLTLSQMLNRFVIVLCNIKPAKFMDVLSCGLLLGAFHNDKSKVEPLQPPETARIGDKVIVQGYYGDPDPIIDINLYEEIAEDFKTNDRGIAQYQGSPLMTSVGPCFVNSLFNCMVA